MKITDEMLKEAVRKSESFRGLVNMLGLKMAGGTQTHYKNRILALNLDTSHFLGKSIRRGKIDSKRRPFSSILIKRETGGREKAHLLKRALMEAGVPYECSKCKNDGSWQGGKLTLDIDHIDRNWLDSRIENLRFLCPNCHSQYSRKLI